MFFIVVRKNFLYLQEMFFIKKCPKELPIFLRKFFSIRVSQKAPIDYIFSLVPTDIMHMYLFSFWFLW